MSKDEKCSMSYCNEKAVVGGMCLRCDSLWYDAMCEAQEEAREVQEDGD